MKDKNLEGLGQCRAGLIVPAHSHLETFDENSFWRDSTLPGCHISLVDVLAAHSDRITGHPAPYICGSSVPACNDSFVGKGIHGSKLHGLLEKYCSSCQLRGKCLRSPSSKARQVRKVNREMRRHEKSAVQRMIERFDSMRGRFFHSRRKGTVEPVFTNIRYTLVLDRFTPRGREKVDTQW